MNCSQLLGLKQLNSCVILSILVLPLYYQIPINPILQKVMNRIFLLRFTMHFLLVNYDWIRIAINFISLNPYFQILLLCLYLVFSSGFEIFLKIKYHHRFLLHQVL
ncbi:hypothetical protein FGO68_gene17809 [Halteria grandinella]|uniref:Uncharacterized protein n=1 Tax=Halteria grandinella TaxID=5974 RepID=A0A8J8NGL4_HALGN|nr:hypothetical protein FGO68_gene17809 [Halteria grandinella]